MQNGRRKKQAGDIQKVRVAAFGKIRILVPGCLTWSPLPHLWCSPMMLGPTQTSFSVSWATALGYRRKADCYTVASILVISEQQKPLLHPHCPSSLKNCFPGYKYNLAVIFVWNFKLCSVMSRYAQTSPSVPFSICFCDFFFISFHVKRDYYSDSSSMIAPSGCTKHFLTQIRLRQMVLLLLLLLLLPHTPMGTHSPWKSRQRTPNEAPRLIGQE